MQFPENFAGYQEKEVPEEQCTSEFRTDAEVAQKLVENGRFEEALRIWQRQLGAGESADLWNDWASTQFALGRPGEAEEGFHRAIELLPGHPRALGNLGVLLHRAGRFREANEYLSTAIRLADTEDQPLLQQAAAHCRQSVSNAGAGIQATDKVISELQQAAGADGNALAYFTTHARRYLATLELLPAAAAGARLLELGAGFHHLTPLLAGRWGYQVRCADLWQGAAQRTWRCHPAGSGVLGTDALEIVVDNFDITVPPWPYQDAQFEVVLFCEMLEHLAVDPMAVLAEIGRALRPAGRLLLTTPNAASLKSLEYVLRGESPYIYGQFEPGGRGSDRHNREYTPGEVRRLLRAAGFSIEILKTHNSWWLPDRGLLRLLAARGDSIALRDDNILVLARKDSAVRQRYPSEFYNIAGTQAERRAQQGASSAGAARPGPVNGKRVLVIHEVLPHTDCSGSDVRLMQVLRALREQQCAVTYVARHGDGREKYARALESMSIRVFAHDPERLRFMGCNDPPAWSFDEVLRDGAFDLAILFHWYWAGPSVTEHYLSPIRQISPATRIAILTDDRHALREHRMAQLTGSLADQERAHDFAQREAEAYSRADVLLCISEEDRKDIQQMCPHVPSMILPMVADQAPPGPAFADRQGLLFLGNFENLANREGIEWFLSHVWPHVRRQLPFVELSLAGHGRPPDFANVPGIRALGRVADLPPVFNAHRVFVSPIRFGTGIKTKNLAALAHGIPLVTTYVGAEGMALVPGRHAMIADSPEEFARAIARVYAHPRLWFSLAVDGRNHVRVHFSPETLRAQVRLLLLAEGPGDRSRSAHAHPWSFLVEQLAPEILLHEPASERMEKRIQAYARRSEMLLGAGQSGAACEQLRHIFALVRDPVPQNDFFARVWALLARCYLELGDVAGARLTSQQARACFDAAHPVVRLHDAPHHSRPCTPRAPEISVLVPTFNRAGILRQCLQALAQQTLRPENFEVVVVDDGSRDDTPAVCSAFQSKLRLSCLCQPNAGAGAARRAGVEQAHGEYLLLINDDTIAAPSLLQEHLQAQQDRKGERPAILGSFLHSEKVCERALPFFLSRDPLLFPQVDWSAGEMRGPEAFITCNLSVRRDVVLAAGSFDPAFRVAEDSELGLRLARQGCRVLYHPAARAVHEHAQFTALDLVRRARAYGRADFQLLRKHPHVLGEGRGPFGRMDAAAMESMRLFVAAHAQEVRASLAVLQKLDDVPFAPLLQEGPHPGSRAAELLQFLNRAVPLIHSYHLFESFLAQWTAEPAAPPSASRSAHPQQNLQEAAR